MALLVTFLDSFDDNIRNIRERIKQNITHIILCLPTYKFNGYSDLDNSRIEYFGNQLIQNLGRQDIVIIFNSYRFLDKLCFINVMAY